MGARLASSRKSSADLASRCAYAAINTSETTAEEQTYQAAMEKGAYSDMQLLRQHCLTHSFQCGAHTMKIKSKERVSQKFRASKPSVRPNNVSAIF